MKKNFLDEMAAAAILLYQNMDEESIAWVISNLQEINEEVQKTAVSRSERLQISAEKELKIALNMIKELIDMVNRRNTLELADCLKYRIYEYIRSGAAL